MLGSKEDEWFWNITVLIYGIMSGGEYDFKQWFIILEQVLAAHIMAMYMRRSGWPNDVFSVILEMKLRL